MKSARLRNGDFVLSSNGEVTMATGKERLVQELTCWLLEPLGTDPANNKFGSRLSDLVGTAILSGTATDIKAEVTRVLTNYMAYQERILNSYMFDSTGLLKYYSTSEIIGSIDEVKTRVRGDLVEVLVSITTLAGEQVTLQQTVS
jgi:hypothetical protein